MADDLMTRVYRVFDPAPLEPDQVDLYVKLDDVLAAHALQPDAGDAEDFFK